MGDHAVIEARKGLSRLLRADDPNDLSLFAHQLHTSDKAACEPNYQNYTETVPSFALSYVQQRPPEGSRFKFSSEQWQRFLRIVGELCKCGVVHFRVWLDQCLWLRDASQESWAHTGIMPYILWPVLSLGDRVMGADRTWQSRQRMWPFVEEVAGLWSLGLIMASEMRGKTMQSGVRDWMSFNLRLKCEPERSVWIVLLNIFHGATDHLQTGWREDVEELNEMAKLNFTRQVQNVIIGSDWRSRVTSAQFRYDVVTAVMLPVDPKYFGMPGQGVDMYLDGSRTVFNQDRWDGKQEWLSGMNIKLPYDFPNVNGLDVMGFMSGLSGLAWWNVITDKGEFQLLSNNALTSALWLLVAMDGATSGYGRGHVAWTKVLHGKITCELSRFSQITATQFDDGGYMLVQKAIQEQLERQVQILSLKLVTGVNIEWT